MAAPILVIYNPEEREFLSTLASLSGGRELFPFKGPVDLLSELWSACQRKGITEIVTTREDILHKLIPIERRSKAKLANYAGSMIPVSLKDPDKEPWFGKVMPIDPLFQLRTVRHGKWVAERYMTKFAYPEKWRKTSNFNWKEITNWEEFNHALKVFTERAWLVAVDTETIQPNIIRCVGYTAFKHDGTSETFTFPIKSMDAVLWMRSLNNTPVYKCLQNGKYDCAYFTAYNAPLVGYIADTKNALHAWFSELPKDLAFIASVLIRDSMYWKDIGDTGTEYDTLKYCALDTWATGEAFLGWLSEAPNFARTNYVQEFTQVPIDHEMEMRGIKRDMVRLEIEATKTNAYLDNKLASLQQMVATLDFNPSSPVQVVKLLRILGNKAPDEGRDKISSNEKVLQKDRLKHPINERILGSILDYRGERKLASTYLTTGDKSKEYKGRILYSLNPDGTDTGRHSSREHHFWCGLQIQNVPADSVVKETLVADPGYDIVECDFEQAEARGVAYCSGDLGLLDAVNGPNDFHSWNAAAFFGIPYDEIYCNATRTVLNKVLRNLAKRVNHGANYNMGPGVLLDTMGDKAVRDAQRLLNLPTRWSLIDITTFLLERYEATYPRVKGSYYASIKREIKITGMMLGPTGWTRVCFGDPSSNKLDLNAYVAHKTQSLNGMILNEAVRRTYLWRKDNNLMQDIQILAQIHDSQLVQVRHERHDLIPEVARIMTFPVQIVDCVGIEREMIVPVGIKINGPTWGGH